MYQEPLGSSWAPACTYLGTSDLSLDNDRHYDGHSTQDTAKWSNYASTIAQTWQRFANPLSQCSAVSCMHSDVLFCVKPQCVYMPSTIAEQHTTTIFIHKLLPFQCSIANSVTGYNYTGRGMTFTNIVLGLTTLT